MAFARNGLLPLFVWMSRSASCGMPGSPRRICCRSKPTWMPPTPCKLAWCCLFCHSLLDIVMCFHFALQESLSCNCKPAVSPAKCPCGIARKLGCHLCICNGAVHQELACLTHHTVLYICRCSQLAAERTGKQQLVRDLTELIGQRDESIASLRDTTRRREAHFHQELQCLRDQCDSSNGQLKAALHHRTALQARCVALEEHATQVRSMPMSRCTCLK